ncbi:hypothetical protein, partial [Pseudomonas sp. BIOMIG1BD]|uniref:hypothetical protein n=1 Tax=Pseudomonas sp. BIOMIG1BD TaxID=1758731 RepID=UPI0019D3C26A
QFQFNDRVALSSCNRPVFTDSFTVWSKKHLAIWFCARLLHPARHRLRGMSESETLKTHDNSGRAAQKYFESVCLEGSFPPCNPPKSTIEVVSPDTFRLKDCDTDQAICDRVVKKLKG